MKYYFQKKLDLKRCLTLIMMITFFIVSCSEKISNTIKMNCQPKLWPDYIGVTIPKNIAPLNFSTENFDSLTQIKATIKTLDGTEYFFSGENFISFDEKTWKEILQKSINQEFQIEISEVKNSTEYVYKPFFIKVSEFEVDKYVSYRLLAPGYEIYSRMGIYCRNLENFDQTTVVDNRLINANCLNCHSFKQGDTEFASLHIRGDLSATVLKKNGKIEICNPVTDKYKLNCVYPYWHPSGRFIAYSQNNTAQAFHCSSPNRVEVYDLKSRVVVYDTLENKLLTTKALNNDSTFTTEPAFSNDGKYLYFTTAKALDMAKHTQEVRYDICRIEFNAQNGEFGKVDTLLKLSSDTLTAAFPRPSYDGKYLLYTKFNYGQFAIWHKEADLWMLNLKNGKTFALEKSNGKDADSYHSWSQNSRWIIFESRRDDGFYTRLYIAFVNEDGTTEKAFMIPQKSPEDNRRLMLSYNVPEFSTKEFKLNKAELETKLKSKEKKQFKD